jgi:peptide deformylase
MAKLKILKKGDPILRRVCRPVTEITPRILTLLDDMTETLHDANGAGLAASQVGILRRIVVIETPESGLIELINPEIIKTSGEQRAAEGCLSIPGEWGITRRPATVTVRALNRKGETVEITGTDLLARAFCHETDHLDGKLFTDEGTLVERLEPEE